VPQVLLDALAATRDPRTVLCTQPRRLAVVTIAERVALERRCTLGGEVGYVIGQRSMLSGGVTKLQFTTAGSLLERLRTKGEAALTGVRCDQSSPQANSRAHSY
jgi:HrpA-like RNA helicase